MSPMLFTEGISRGGAIDVRNHGNRRHDFNYIDHLKKGVICTLDKPTERNQDPKVPSPESGESIAPNWS